MINNQSGWILGDSPVSAGAFSIYCNRDCSGIRAFKTRQWQPCLQMVLLSAFSIQGYPRILSPTAIPSKGMHDLLLKPLQAKTSLECRICQTSSLEELQLPPIQLKGTSEALKRVYNSITSFSCQNASQKQSRVQRWALPGQIPFQWGDVTRWQQKTSRSPADPQEQVTAVSSPLWWNRIFPQCWFLGHNQQCIKILSYSSKSLQFVPTSSPTASVGSKDK